MPCAPLVAVIRWKRTLTGLQMIESGTWNWKIFKTYAASYYYRSEGGTTTSCPSLSVSRACPLTHGAGSPSTTGEGGPVKVCRLFFLPQQTLRVHIDGALSSGSTSECLLGMQPIGRGSILHQEMNTYFPRTSQVTLTSEGTRVEANLGKLPFYHYSYKDRGPACTGSCCEGVRLMRKRLAGLIRFSRT